MSTSKKLNLQLLRDRLSGAELAAGRSKIAQEIAGMTPSEQEAFKKGLNLGCNAALTSGDAATTAHVLAALLLAIEDD